MDESIAIILSEEIHEMQVRLAHYMNCEVQDEMLDSLRESIKKKQLELLDLLEEEGINA